MTFQVAGSLVLAGLAVLDATPVGQTLFSQPLVTAAVLGWLWGDWSVALSVGVVLQILAASTLPVGSRTPEDYAVGGVIGTTLALMLASEQPFEMARDASRMLGCLAGLVTAMLGVGLLKWQRRTHEGLGPWVDGEIAEGRERALGRAQGAAVVLAFAVGVTFAAVSLGLGLWALRPLVAHDSIRLSRAWSLAQPLWIGLGLAQLLNAFVNRRLTRAALFGVTLLTTWLILMVGAP
jgi:mannose/fructose/N-acetylgalactosamine-specific phosphotransferase system component IIC